MQEYTPIPEPIPAHPEVEATQAIRPNYAIPVDAIRGRPRNPSNIKIPKPANPFYPSKKQSFASEAGLERTHMNKA
jgi:hypothetical protein